MSIRSDEHATPTPWQVLKVWLVLGLQSFGGGAATLFLIRRAVVDQRHWISDEEFTRNWAICQVVPGINLLGMTILVGWRVAGVVGVALALVGLLLPSVTITVALTALYAGVQQFGMVQSALRGVIPATVGLGLLLVWQTGRPLMAAAQREGRGSVAVALVALAGSAVIVLLRSGVPVIVVLCGAGAISALFHWWTSRTAQDRHL